MLTERFTFITPMTDSKQIVIYGQDVTLLNTRAWVLRRSGFDVHTSTEFEGLRGQGESQNVDLLILCHTLNDDALSKALELAKSKAVPIREV